MKKRLFSIIIALSVFLGTVPVYAQTNSAANTVPTQQYVDALLVLYSENYAYLLQRDSSEIYMLVNSPTLISQYTTKEELLNHIQRMNYAIYSLENINKLITENTVDSFYAIQPAIVELISSSKTYVDGCTQIYNNNPYGYRVASSSLPSIFDSREKISTFCDSINLVSMSYLAENVNIILKGDL